MLITANYVSGFSVAQLTKSTYVFLTPQVRLACYRLMSPPYQRQLQATIASPQNSPVQQQTCWGKTLVTLSTEVRVISVLFLCHTADKSLTSCCLHCNCCVTCFLLLNAHSNLNSNHCVCYLQCRWSAAVSLRVFCPIARTHRATHSKAYVCPATKEFGLYVFM